MAESRTTRPWPLWLAPLTAIVLPTATVRRTERMRLWQAALVHVFGAALTAAAIVALVAWASSEDLLSITAWYAALIELLAVVMEWRVDSRAVGALLSLTMAAEAGMIVAAWGLMAWGARDELTPASFAASLRRVWCASPHAAVVLPAAGAALVLVSQMPHSHAQETLFPATYAVLFLWILTVSLRVGAAPRWGARCRWPAVCEGCGYALLGIDWDGPCPECGLAVAASVGEDARPGVFGRSAAEPRRFVGKGVWRAWFRRWWRWTVDSVARPVMFGSRLRALHSEGAHRRLLLVNALLIGAINAVGSLAARLPDSQVEISASLLFGVMAACGTIALTLGAASLVGSMATRLTLFPLMHVACQGACALSGLLIVWLIGNWLAAAAIGLAADELGLAYWLWLEWLAYGVVAVNAAVLATYMVLLWRIVMAARFANW